MSACEIPVQGGFDYMIWRTKNKRTSRLLLKLTPDECAQIEKAAAIAGETMNEYIREAVASRIGGK